MKKLYRKKLDKQIIKPLIIFFIISILSIYSASNNLLILKQTIWYILGIVIINFILKIDNKDIYKYYKLLYLLGNLLLLLLLFFAPLVNNSKCWFNIGPFTFQPSEFMKIILIITNAIVIHNNRDKKDFIIILKVLILTLIPSILTFLEPDTGMILIYFIISFTMLFISGIKREWFTISFLFLILLLTIFFTIYFYYNDLFIDIFGTNFFYRIDRLLDWKNGTGYQLTNALIAVGSAHIFGFGFNNTPLYFPEAQTDFIFSVFASNFGFIGITILLYTILLFDLHLIN